MFFDDSPFFVSSRKKKEQLVIQCSSRITKQEEGQNGRNSIEKMLSSTYTYVNYVDQRAVAVASYYMLRCMACKAGRKIVILDTK